ncbi:MerR family transcriptional regulator [Aerococcaceae bacterium NML130460]|nr:MerR family transcriptional regulator [Aerococcaceae bacterium NML180378]MCW6680926.1 MerR family transcriptional regulator [Aerococcaceae bacterium NML130460]
MYLIQEAARISGVSVRTLRYYDKIGLLKPNKMDNQYRYYTNADLDRLQHILFYKYLGFPLREIQRLLSQPSQSRLMILTEQLALMQQEQAKLLTLVQTLEQTISDLKGEIYMSNEQKFAGFKYEDHRRYRTEAVDKYGEKVVRAAEVKQNGNEQVLTDAMNAVFIALAENHQKAIALESDSTQEQVGTLFHLMREYVFDCSLEVFGKIGLGYAADNRFRENIDQFGVGTAQYVCDAIQVYVQAQSSIA